MSFGTTLAQEQELRIEATANPMTNDRVFLLFLFVDAVTVFGPVTRDKLIMVVILVR